MDNGVLTRNKKLALVISASHQVAIVSPVWVIFGTDKLNLSLTQSLMLGYMALATSAFFEIPMGAFADKFGRKATLIAGLFLTAFGDLTLIMFDNFTLLMVLQIFAGLGWAMRTGTLEGLLHDTFEAYGDKTTYSKLSGKMLTLSSISRVVTVPLGAYLYVMSPDAKLSSYTYPFIGEVIFFIIAIICVTALSEARSHKVTSAVMEFSGKDSVSKHISATFKEMYRSKDLVRIVVLLYFYAIIGEGNWSLYQLYFRDRNINVQETGWVYSVIFALMAVGAYYVVRIYEKVNVVWAMNFIILAVSIGVVMMHMALPIAIVGFMINAIVSPMCFHLHDNAIQNRMSGDRKSTALSIASMGYTIGSVIGTIGVGWVADKYGVLNAQWIFVAVGVFIFAIVGFFSISEGFSVLPIDRMASEKPVIDLVELEDLEARGEQVSPGVQDLDGSNDHNGSDDHDGYDDIEIIEDDRDVQATVTPVDSVDITAEESAAKESVAQESVAQESVARGSVAADGDVTSKASSGSPDEPDKSDSSDTSDSSEQSNKEKVLTSKASSLKNVVGIQNAFIDSKRF